MSDYSPSLVYEHEVRNSFTPPLEYNDISKADVLNKIEMVENYIKYAFFDGTMPSRTVGKIPALMIVMSKVIKGNPSLAEKYADINSLELGDYSIKYDVTARGAHVNAYESARSWEEMAIDILEAQGSNKPKVILVNG